MKQCSLILLILAGGLAAWGIVGCQNRSETPSPAPAAAASSASGTSSTATASPATPVTDNSSALPGMQTTEAPWPPQISQLQDRLGMMGLPALRREGTELHIHQHLDLFINGKTVSVPPMVGINMVAGFIAPVHTHDGSGVIHIESPIVNRYTLGQFFDIWGVRLTQTCLGAYCNTGDKALRVFVNGAAVTTNPREIELTNDQEIVVTYGAESELPKPMPSTFKGPTT